MKSLIVVLSLMFAFSSFADVTVALVDIQKVITSVKEGQAVNKTLEKSFNAKKEILKKEEEKIKKAQEDYKKQAAVLSEPARLTKERDIQDQILKLQNKTMEYQKEIQAQENDLKKPLLDKLRPIIDEVSVASAADLTFELTSAPIIYAKIKKEITDDVIKVYDKKHPGK